jgi:hypothetical protein
MVSVACLVLILIENYFLYVVKWAVKITGEWDDDISGVCHLAKKSVIPYASF